MEGWELLLYLILFGIVLYISYILIYHLFLAIQYSRTSSYLKIEDQSTSINGFFDGYPIYYINLDRSFGRYQHMNSMIKKYSIDNITRISAVDGNNINVSYEVKDYSCYTMSELACTLSHIKAIKTSYDNGDEAAVILEDDCGFGLLSVNKVKLIEIANNAPNDWEYINLCPLNPKLNLYSNEYVSNTECYGYGTSAYLINRKGMEKILTKIGNNKIDYNECLADYLYSDVLLPKLTISYSYNKSLFYQNKTLPKEVKNSFTPIV